VVVLYSSLLWSRQSAPLLQSSTASCNLPLFRLNYIYLLLSVSLFPYIYINLCPIYALKVFIIYSIVYIPITIVVYKKTVCDIDVC
jgi:hypothetical protein